MPSRPLFRESALRRLGSPDRLDTIAGVRARVLWPTVLAALALGVAIALWLIVDGLAVGL